ncbi:MAG: MAPEG family protein [Luminiphilus sp.]|nr:MAPEG family protein [Luminiphilus sp.]
MLNVEIIFALMLLLVHVWLVPMVFSLAHGKWLLGARDDVVELSVLAQRSKRAAANYMESLPAFITIALLLKIEGIDTGSLAMYWLSLRGVYLILYVLGTPIIRSIVWGGSVLVLIKMALALF